VKLDKKSVNFVSVFLKTKLLNGIGNFFAVISLTLH